MGVKHVSQADFARLCACSREAVSKAAERMEVFSTTKGKVPLNQQNCGYRDKLLYRKIGEQLLQGRVLPEWACLVGDHEEEHVALWWYPPHGTDENDAYPSEEAWGFDFDMDHGKATRQEDGVVFTLRLVTRGDAPPPWLDAESPKRPAGRRAPKAVRA